MSKSKFIKDVVCLFNGSVESSVAALLLKRKGFHVTGIFLQNKYQNPKLTQLQQDSSHASCKLLDIPLKEVELSEQQWKPFEGAIIEDFRRGFNPDLSVLFTKHILCGSMFDHARTQQGSDAVSLPFYIRTDAGYDIDRFTEMQGMKIFKAVDQVVDDSFLVCQTPQKVLQRSIFPLGDLTQEVVKLIAQSVGLDKIPSHKANHLLDSAVIMKSLDSVIDKKPGRIISVTTRKTLGHHKEFHMHSAGEAFDLNGNKFYVAEKDVRTGDIYVVEEADHPSMLSDTLFTAYANWSHKTPYHFYTENQMMDCDFRWSNNQGYTKCSLTVGTTNEYCGNDHIILSSCKPMKGIVPGHYCAFYIGEECLGSGKIVKPGPSDYAMNYSKYAGKASSYSKRKEDSSKNGDGGTWKGLLQKFVL